MLDIDARSVRCKRVTVTVPDNSESVGTQLVKMVVTVPYIEK